MLFLLGVARSLKSDAEDDLRWLVTFFLFFLLGLPLEILSMIVRRKRRLFILTSSVSSSLSSDIPPDALPDAPDAPDASPLASLLGSMDLVVNEICKMKNYYVIKIFNFLKDVYV
jgi:hypothetical protein